MSNQAVFGANMSQASSHQESRAATSAVPGVWPHEGLESLDACPACGGSDSDLLHTGLRDWIWFTAPGEWTMRQCRACGVGYLNPRPTIETIAAAYETYDTHGAPVGDNVPRGPIRRLRRALRNGYLNAKYGYDFAPASPSGAWIVPLLPSMRFGLDRWMRHLGRARPGARLLDVGCGNGQFLVLMRDLGWTVAGLDLDPACADAATKAGLDVRLGVLEDNSFPDDHFDAITLNHVVEHLHDPVATLRRCRRMLRAGGTIWLATPNLASDSHRLYGKHWRGLEPPRHLVLYTPDALASLLRAAGFTPSAPKRTTRVADFFFRTSAAIAANRDPKTAAPLPLRRKLRSLLTDAKSWVTPESSDELIMSATTSST